MRKQLTGVAALMGGETYTLADLKNERIDRCGAMAAIINSVEAERRGFTVDEEKQLNNGFGEIEQLDVEIEKKDRQDQLAKAAAVARSRSRNQFGELNPVSLLPTTATTPEVPHDAHHVAPGIKCFTSHQQARTAGMMIVAMVARARGRQHDQAETFLASCGHNVQAALREGAGVDGGYLVPDPLAAGVINVRAAAGVMRQLATVMPMTADSLAVAKQTGGPSVVYPGEAGSITESDIDFGQISLIAVKRSVFSLMSNELNDDAIINMAEYVAAEFGYQLAKQEDNEAINGDSTSTYGGETGILAAIGSAGVSQAATGHDTWAELDIPDVVAAMAKLPSRYSDNTAFVCSQQFYVSVMLRLQAAAGGTSMMDLAGGPGSRPMFLGRPVYLTDQMPTATAAATVCALYGNFAQAVMLGDRLPVRFDVSPHYKFQNDQLALRAIARYDWNWHAAGDSSNAGAVVALKTAA